MEVTLKPTPEVAFCDGSLVRIWRGTTSSGQRIMAMIVAVAPEDPEGDTSELTEHLRPIQVEVIQMKDFLSGNG